MDHGRERYREDRERDRDRDRDRYREREDYRDSRYITVTPLSWEPQSLI